VGRRAHGSSIASRSSSNSVPDETRMATTGADFESLGFHPTRYILDWNVAVMDGPAGGDEREFRRETHSLKSAPTGDSLVIVLTWDA